MARRMVGGLVGRSGVRGQYGEHKRREVPGQVVAISLGEAARSAPGVRGRGP